MQVVVIAIFLLLSAWGFAVNGAAFFLPFLLLGFIAFMAWGFLGTTSSEKTELTEEEKSRVHLEREKFDALGDSVEEMTLAEIASAVGGSERSIINKLIRANLSCADFDGVKHNEKTAAAGGPEMALAALVEESGNNRRFGLINPALVCPHCQTKGKVRSSIGANEAVLTSSNTYKAKSSTKMHCDECGVDWSV